MIEALSFALWLLASLADAWTTHRFLTRGTGRELNPALRWLFARVGVKAGLAIKMAVALAVGIAALHFGVWYALLPLAALTGYVARRNWRLGRPGSTATAPSPSRGCCWCWPLRRSCSLPIRWWAQFVGAAASVASSKRVAPMHDSSLGDQAQVRRIVEQVVIAVDDLKGDKLASIEKDIERKVAREVKTAMSSVKIWVLGGVAANLIPLLLFAYQFGQYAKTIDDAIGIVRQQQIVLADRGQWMGGVESRLGGLEQWAGPKGYRPPPKMELPR